MIIDFYYKYEYGGKFENPYRENKYFQNKNITEKVTDKFALYTASHTIENHFAEKEGRLYFICGNIFKRLSEKDFKEKVGVNKFAKDIFENENNINNYKGNFIAAEIEIATGNCKIFNSQLGIKNLYYFSGNKKFIISTNLNLIRNEVKDINTSAVSQHLYFTFPINKETFLKDVYRAEPGEIIQFKNENINIRKYYDIKNIFIRSKGKFDENLFTEIFNRSVYQRAKWSDKINVSFTGGFDGRTIISSLMAQGIDFKSYSFGIKGGENTEVPKGISKKLGINYEPVYLEEEYEDCYDIFAENIIINSDGISFNERSNYPFAFDKISKYSRTVLSGLIGGEILRPIHLATDYMNERYYDIFYRNTKFRTINNFEELLPEIYNEELIKSVIEKRQQDLQDEKEIPSHLKYLWDLMCTGFRMYYGTEIHSERLYAENLTPYYDLDLIEYLFSTDYTEIFKNAFKRSKFARRKGQEIYSKIIEKNYPQLNRFNVDRGYMPVYLIKPYLMPLIPIKNFIRNKRKHLMPDFRVEHWSKKYFEKIIPGLNKNNYYDKIKLVEFYKSMNNDTSEFSRILSLIIWLNNVK